MEKYVRTRWKSPKSGRQGQSVRGMPNTMDQMPFMVSRSGHSGYHLGRIRKSSGEGRFGEMVDGVSITYFVHGTTTDNENGISSGWSDAKLSELGVRQSLELGRLVADEHFDVVFCSDLSRAVDTARYAWGGKCQIIKDARLRECNYGDYNAKPSELVEPLQERSVTKPMPNGESYEMVKDRIASFLTFLKRDYAGKSVAIVGHKAPQLALDVLLQGKHWEQAFAQDWRKTKSWQPGWEYALK